MRRLLAGLCLFLLLTVVHLESYGFTLPGAVALAYLTVGLAALLCLATGVAKRRRAQVAWSAAILAAVVGSALVANLVTAMQESASRARGDAIAVALAAWHEQKGRYPSKLHQLVPEFLPEVPVSAMGVWRREPFHYSRSVDRYDLRFHCLFFNECWRGPAGVWGRGD